jgi:hypothetical protein
MLDEGEPTAEFPLLLDHDWDRDWDRAFLLKDEEK